MIGNTFPPFLDFSFFGLASSSDPSLFPESACGTLAFSVSRTIWSRGTFNSKISSTVDKANDTSTDATEKCLTIINLEAGRSGVGRSSVVAEEGI
jgi:hypothetical protein